MMETNSLEPHFIICEFDHRFASPFGLGDLTFCLGDIDNGRTHCFQIGGRVIKSF